MDFYNIWNEFAFLDRWITEGWIWCTKKVIDTISTIYAEENVTAENSLTLIQVKQKRGKHFTSDVDLIATPPD